MCEVKVESRTRVEEHGRPVLYDQLEKTGTPGAEEIRVESLTVQDNRGLTAVDGLSLSVRAGEILGIAAIEGNGQSELLEAIAGMRPVEHGKIFVHEQDVTAKRPGRSAPRASPMCRRTVLPPV